MKPTLLSLLLLALLACKKDNIDPDGLVRATQQGKNTGDFLLSGKPFNPLAAVATPADKPVGASWYHSRKGSSSIQLSFFRQERDKDRTESSLNIYIAHITAAGTYPLVDPVNPFVIPGAQSSAQYETRGDDLARSKRYFLTGPISPGQVLITRFDTVARVVSGTFEAQLREYNGPETLSVTKGRFDCFF